MSTVDVERLRQIKTLPLLVKFLRDELDWPIEVEEVDGLTFDYTSEELGLDEKHAAKIKEIKQLRPLDSKQPWGIFWVSFEKKRLPMVVLRRILGNLIIKTRAGARKADRPSWHLHDLLFISSYGEEEHRNVSFAHFTEDPVTDELPVLRVLGWDDQNSVMHLDRVANQLHTHLRWPADPNAVDAWRQRWSDAFTDRYLEAIRSVDELIPRLAHLAGNIRRRVRDVLDAETERGPMRHLFAAVQRLLIHDMNEDGFADMYAQTVAYGLLSARFSRPVGLTAQNLVQLTAVSNPFLENLLENLFRLNRGKFNFDVDEVGINDVLDLLRNTNMEAIKAAFSDKNPAEDPVIRFYEGFLKQYDPKQRVKRGVFFTPRPVVSYIVRSVHELLQTEFGLADGLASIDTWADMKKRFADLKIPQGTKPDDPFVCILDPATGTGTFLFECIEVIERTMKEKWCRKLGKKSWNDIEINRRWQEYVPRHLLPRLYGYELMMAPYSIAHLKLALKLGETGYQFREGDRLHIYLTNSLEPPTPLADAKLADMFGVLASEAQEVNEIKKNKRFTVVIGNPPYAGHSANNGEWISALVDDYYFVNGEPLGERTSKWLQDDYVKFLRLAQHTIATTQIGIVGFITNHGYLDNPTFRGMRHALLNAFPAVRVLDLHGSLKKKEKSPDGTKDENVFEIQPGVAVCLLVRFSSASVRHADLFGLHDSKYRWLGSASLSSTEWHEHRPVAPFFILHPQDSSLRDEYARFWKTTDVFPLNGVGMTTARDQMVIDFDRQPLLQRARRFRDATCTDADLCHELGIPLKKGWNVGAARRLLQKELDLDHRICPVAYRPFDDRLIFYHDALVWRTVKAVMRHMLAGHNLAIAVGRAGQVIDQGEWNLVYATRKITEFNLYRRGGNNLAPLYLYGGGDLLSSGGKRLPNLDQRFLQELAAALDLSTEGSYSIPTGIMPEDVFYYAYTVLHSPGYRGRYAEFLRIDFPRLPLPGSLELFRALARQGSELVALHLMESPELIKPITKWKGAIPSSEVEKVAYADETVWIDKTQTEGFRGVPEDVWNFHIGGYQVCHKWLDDRRKARRQLSADDIAHYQKIVVALAETIRMMGEIDAVIDEHGGWPGAFAAEKT